MSKHTPGPWRLCGRAGAWGQSMKERPILMSAPMVRAILDGRKTQTRRPLKHQPPDCAGVWSFVACSTNPEWRDTFCYSWPDANGNSYSVRGRESCMHISPLCFTGDRLWVRETWAWYPLEEDASCVIYRADCKSEDRPPAEFGTWKPSIHMPRWASRITLKITDVRVEQLREITAEDATAEGFTGHDPTAGFADAWNEIYGGLSWANNHWVWVIEFRREEL